MSLKRAWTAIKATAEEQRTLWLEVGVALMYGKLKENRPGQKFSEWVQEMFPGLAQAHASDAIWWSEFSNTVLEIPDGLTHPQVIRRWHTEQQATAALPPDAPKVNTKTTQEFASQRDAEKFIKVDQRAETG